MHCAKFEQEGFQSMTLVTFFSFYTSEKHGEYFNIILSYTLMFP